MLRTHPLLPARITNLDLTTSQVPATGNKVSAPHSLGTANRALFSGQPAPHDVCSDSLKSNQETISRASHPLGALVFGSAKSLGCGVGLCSPYVTLRKLALPVLFDLSRCGPTALVFGDGAAWELCHETCWEIHLMPQKNKSVI